MSTPPPSETPRTFDAFDSYNRGACGKKYLYDCMAEMERELQQFKEWAKDAAELLDSMPCMSSGQEREQERLLNEFIALTTKGNEA